MVKLKCIINHSDEFHKESLKKVPMKTDAEVGLNYFNLLKEITLFEGFSKKALKSFM